jgi:dihydroorotase-like cyclic amidohydrolase
LLHERPQYLYAFHAEDSIVIEKNLKNKQVSVENYAEIRSVEAEYQAVKAILDFATLKNRLHFVHISSQKAAELIIKKKIKHSISWETCPHYLQFTKKDFPVLRGKLKTAPPVKSEEDRTFLREQLINGNLDFVATDHAGCDYSTEKDMTDFAKIYNGIPGTQLMLPYLISEFYNKNKISLAQLIQLTSENAAKRYGLYPQKGSLEISSDADFTIIDCNDFYIVDEKKLLCKGNYSPFHGLSFSASILLTILRGNPVFSKQNGMIASPGIGKLLRRKNIEPD